MSDQITIRADGRAEMAYVGEVPWHSKGQQKDRNDSLDSWQVDSGMDYDILSAPVQFKNGSMHTWPEHQVLYRSDTNEPLSVVTSKYKIVQPKEILEFFRSLIEQRGFEMETAGTLKGGRRFWALARTGFDGEVVPGDMIKTFLLAYSSCDGSLATNATFCSIRVVCNNTLQMVMKASQGNRISVRHNTEFDPESVKMALGLGASDVYKNFMGRMQKLANTTLSESMANEIIAEMLAKTAVNASNKPIRETFGFKTIMQLFNGVGKGSQLDGVAGTGWGLVNAVTEYTDFHARSRSAENRRDSAWFGNGLKMKEESLVLLESI